MSDNCIDLTAARMPQDRPDVREAVVDGELQPVLSPRGVILLAWSGWKKDGMPKAKDALRRYCEYISGHGYRGGASVAVSKLDTMDLDSGTRWIKQTFARYVRDQTALIQYVLPE